MKTKATRKVPYRWKNQTITSEGIITTEEILKKLREKLKEYERSVCKHLNRSLFEEKREKVVEAVAKYERTERRKEKK